MIMSTPRHRIQTSDRSAAYQNILVYEFPKAEGDPYYPIPHPENGELYKQYKALADHFPEFLLAGRLATYKYYNMDQVVAQALSLFDRISDNLRAHTLEVEHEPAVIYTPLIPTSPALGLVGRNGVHQ